MNGCVNIMKYKTYLVTGKYLLTSEENYVELNIQ